MACCKRSTGFSHRFLQEINDSLNGISTVFPQVTFICLLNASGEIIFHQGREHDSQGKKEVGRYVKALITVASQFVGIVNQQDCPVIHMLGSSFLLSCYDLEEHTLLFTCSPTDVLDLPKADENMQDILESLKRVLQNLIV